MSDVRLQTGTDRLVPRPGAGTKNLPALTDTPAQPSPAAFKPPLTGPLDANVLSGPAGQQSQYGLTEFATVAAQAASESPAKVFKLVKDTPSPVGTPTLDVRPAAVSTLEMMQAASVTVAPPPPPTTQATQPTSVNAESVPLGLGLATANQGEQTVAPQTAPPPVKKKRRRRRGFFRRLGGALKKGLKKVGGAVAKGIQKVGRAIAKYNPVTLSLKAVASVAGAVGLDGVAKAANKVGDFVEKVGNEIADGAAAIAKATIALDTKDLGTWWKKNSSYVIMAASLVSMIVPGLQPLAIGLAAYQAYQGGKMMVDGIKSGDWKQAALGLVSVAGAVAGGVTAIGAKALGSTAMAVANTAGKVADNTQKAVKAVDAIKNGDYGALIGMAAGAVSSGMEFLGEGAQKIAEQAKTIAEKANTYYQNGKAAYDAFKSGDLTGGVASLMNLATNAVSETKVNPETLKHLETASRYVSQADSLAKAIKTGDVDGALNLVNAIAQQEGLTDRNLIDPDKVKLAGNLEDLTKAITKKDYGAAASLITNLAGEHGLTIPINDELRAKFETVTTYAPLVSDLQKQISAGNFQGTLAAIDRFNAEARKSGRAINEGLTRDLATLADAITNEDQSAIQAALAGVVQRAVG